MRKTKERGRLLRCIRLAAEFALTSGRRTCIDQLVLEGSARTRLVERALTHLDTYIAATQLRITMASLALGFIGEPAIAHLLEPLFASFLPPEVAWRSRDVGGSAGGVLGDATDEFASGREPIEQLANGSYTLDGLLGIEELGERFALALEEPFYDTLGGYVFGQLQRAPK